MNEPTKKRKKCVSLGHICRSLRSLCFARSVSLAPLFGGGASSVGPQRRWWWIRVGVGVGVGLGVGVGIVSGGQSAGAVVVVDEDGVDKGRDKVLEDGGDDGLEDVVVEGGGEARDVCLDRGVVFQRGVVVGRGAVGQEAGEVNAVLLGHDVLVEGHDLSGDGVDVEEGDRGLVGRVQDGVVGVRGGAGVGEDGDDDGEEIAFE